MRIVLTLTTFIFLFFSSYSQERYRRIYVKTISDKIKPSSNALLMFQGCDHVVSYDPIYVPNPNFIEYDFMCDSLGFASHLMYGVYSNSTYPITHEAIKGDLKYVDGDSVIIYLDKGISTIINKGRPNRRNI